MENMDTFKIIKLKSRELLQKYISGNKVLTIGDADEKNRYDIVTTLDDEVICLIAYYFHGIEPEIMDFDDKLYIGINEKFYCINEKTKSIDYQIPLHSIFYEFHIIREGSLIVINAELEVCIINLNGQILFQTGFTDIVCNFSVNDFFVTVETESDGIMTYEIDKIISRGTA